jgi:hypothetical protein
MPGLRRQRGATTLLAATPLHFGAPSTTTRRLDHAGDFQPDLSFGMARLRARAGSGFAATSAVGAGALGGRPGRRKSLAPGASKIVESGTPVRKRLWEVGEQPEANPAAESLKLINSLRETAIFHRDS